MTGVGWIADEALRHVFVKPEIHSLQYEPELTASETSGSRASGTPHSADPDWCGSAKFPKGRAVRCGPRGGGDAEDLFDRQGSIVAAREATR